MELIPFLFVIVIPLAFLVWGLRFKSWLSVLSIPPIMIIVLAVLFLNSDNTLAYKVVTHECGILPYNSTETVDGNITRISYNSTLSCQQFSDDISYTIPGELMTMTNAMTMIGMLSVLFVVFRRVTRKPVEQND